MQTGLERGGIEHESAVLVGFNCTDTNITTADRNAAAAEAAALFSDGRSCTDTCPCKPPCQVNNNHASEDTLMPRFGPRV